MSNQPSEHCHRCDCETITVLLPLSSGHIGRVCAKCRTCRRGRPFAKRNELPQPQHLDAVSRQEVHAHEIHAPAI